MRITSDYHIHTQNSYDAGELSMASLVAAAREKGITHYGVTDHLHTPYNLPDILASRREYDETQKPDTFLFGVEASVVSQWELEKIKKQDWPAHMLPYLNGAPPPFGLNTPDPRIGIRMGGPAGGALSLGLDEETFETVGFDYVVGGVHFALYSPADFQAVVRCYHRQLLFLAQHPLVDIIAHPWWGYNYYIYQKLQVTDVQPDNFDLIDRLFHDEFASAVLENGKAVEINLDAMITTPLLSERSKEQYLDYLAMLQQRGVPLSIGSDCHWSRYDWSSHDQAAPLLDGAGIRLDALFHPHRKGR